MCQKYGLVQVIPTITDHLMNIIAWGIFQFDIAQKNLQVTVCEICFYTSHKTTNEGLDGGSWNWNTINSTSQQALPGFWPLKTTKCFVLLRR